MKLWTVCYCDNDSSSGTVRLWATSRRKLRTMLRAVKKDGPANFAEYETEQVSVPTGRAKLCAFLNRYADIA